MNELLPLTTVRRSDAARAGHKAAVLGTLLEAGYPVPPGVCLTTTAFRRALAPRRRAIDTLLSERDLYDPAGAEAAAANVAALLADLSVPVSVTTALREALAALVDAKTPVAVRSSATAEDRADASFAGQYSSAVGARGVAQIAAAIVACWRSFFSAHALVARAAHDALRADEGMAVLIQPVIDAECAGVCFSVDPVRRRRDRVVVSAAWGLGAGVVDGAVATDTAWLRRDGLQVDQRQVVEQTEQIAPDPAGGLRRAPVPEERRRAACLPEPWLRRVAEFGVAAELLLGRPQDLEWAIADGQVWVLQSRPITALPHELARTPPFPVAWKNEGDRRRVWRPYAMSGRGREALLPLERDDVAAVESTREETCRFIGADRNGKVDFFNGRAYFCPLPLDVTDGDRRVRHAAHEDLKDRLQRQGFTAWDYWGPEIVRATERLRAFARDKADGPALARHLEDALATRCRHFMLHPLCWFKPRQPFYDALAAVSGLSGPEAKIAAHRLLEGEETPLTRLIDGLYELARIASRDPAVAALVAAPPSDALERLAALPEAVAFRARLDQFLAAYGERTGHGYGSETTISTPTWSERPAQLLRLVAAYLDPAVEPPAEARARAERARDAQVQALCDACDDRTAVAEFRRQLAYARRAFTVLDTHNHYIDQMALGQLRHAVTAAARWLVARGALATQEDVSWLYFDEICAALRTPASDSFAEIIAARRAQQAEWAELVPPPILGTPNAALPQRPPLRDKVTERSPAEIDRLTGQGASPGRHRGRARVVSNATGLPELSSGEVLVAENAGPLWTPLFPILGGLVLDGGSLGQHAAATAREYGVPAVIGTGDATRRIPDGTWVRVDGTAGTVELETFSNRPQNAPGAAPTRR